MSTFAWVMVVLALALVALAVLTPRRRRPPRYGYPSDPHVPAFRPVRESTDVYGRIRPRVGDTRVIRDLDAGADVLEVYTSEGCWADVDPQPAIIPSGPLWTRTRRPPAGGR